MKPAPVSTEPSDEAPDLCGTGLRDPLDLRGLIDSYERSLILAALAAAGRRSLH